jgi:hypothetical protein
MPGVVLAVAYAPTRVEPHGGEPARVEAALLADETDGAPVADTARYGAGPTPSVRASSTYAGSRGGPAL